MLSSGGNWAMMLSIEEFQETGEGEGGSCFHMSFLTCIIGGGGLMVEFEWRVCFFLMTAGSDVSLT